MIHGAMSVSIVYETHSTSTDNEAGVASGWLPGQLSETGRRQAAALGERRRGDGIAVVFTSDLRRAVETAEIAFEGSEVPRMQDPRLRECNYGELNGAPAVTVAEQRRKRVDEPFPGGQSYRDVVGQTREFLRDLHREWDGKRVLVIAHSANRWALEHLLNGKPLEDVVAAEFAWQPGWQFTLPDGWE
jgi:broad specificity phosphatase PhoE